jgi:hypothetical protein
VGKFHTYFRIFTNKSSAGVGVTPFSGVLTDLQHHELERTRSLSTPDASDNNTSPYADHRRVGFNWMMRDKNNLMWFSDLLNGVSLAQDLDSSHLDIRIKTYVTQKRKQISQHVFHWTGQSYAFWTPEHQDDHGRALRGHVQGACQQGSVA